MHYKDDLTNAKTLLSTGSHFSHFEQAVAEMVSSTEQQLNQILQISKPITEDSKLHATLTQL